VPKERELELASSNDFSEEQMSTTGLSEGLEQVIMLVIVVIDEGKIRRESSYINILEECSVLSVYDSLDRRHGYFSYHPTLALRSKTFSILDGVVA